MDCYSAIQMEDFRWSGRASDGDNIRAVFDGTRIQVCGPKWFCFWKKIIFRRPLLKGDYGVTIKLVLVGASLKGRLGMISVGAADGIGFGEEDGNGTGDSGGEVGSPHSRDGPVAPGDS